MLRPRAEHEPPGSFSGDDPERPFAASAGVLRTLILPAALLLTVLTIVLAATWPALSAGATYMDDKFYLGAPALRHPSWASVKTIFGGIFTPSAVYGYYQPLSLLSLMLDFLDPAAASSLLPFHRTTLLLHLLNVALIAGLLRALFRNWWSAGLLALLYGLHPLNADAVLWIAERKTVLSTCFAVASMLLYVLYVRQAERTNRGDWKRYGASVLLYACALLAKPTAVPVAALLLVLDYWPLRRLSRAALVEKVPFLIVGVLSTLVALVSQTRTEPTGITQLMNPLYFPLVMGYCISLYLCKTVYPVRLVSDYAGPYPFVPTNIEVLTGVLGAVLVIGAIGLSLRRTRAWMAGGLVFFFAMLPSSGIIRFTSSIAANRSMYLPMVGLLLPLAWGFDRVWNMKLRPGWASALRAGLLSLAALLALASIGATRRYQAHWRDTPTLLQYYLSQAPTDWKLHTRLGNEWIERRDYPSAIAEFREAIRLHPNWAENHLNLGRALFTIGQYEESGRAFASALRQDPNDWRAHILMGLSLSRQNQLASALEEFRTAAQLAPRQAAPHHNLAETFARLGRSDEAIAEYREALRLDPRDRQAQRALDEITSKP